MTPAEWRAHFEAWQALERRARHIVDALDFQCSRICAYIQNWSGRAEKAAQPLELMVNPPVQQRAVEDDPVKASLFLMSLWDFAAPHMK